MLIPYCPSSSYHVSSSVPIEPNIFQIICIVVCVILFICAIFISLYIIQHPSSNGMQKTLEKTTYDLLCAHLKNINLILNTI